MISWPSSAAWPASSNAVASGPVGGTSKTASTEAVSAPVRMRSGWARLPRTSRRASMTIDLPAPVSPVSTLRPGENVTRASSRTARFRMASSRSMVAPMLSLKYVHVQTVSRWRQPGGGPAARPHPHEPLPFPPLELGSQYGEEVLLGKAEESDPGRRLMNGHDVTLLQGEAHLSVERHHHVLVVQQGDLDALVRREHDRAVGEGVRADRRQDDRGHSREDDWPSGGEGIGGGACRGRDDEAIRPIPCRELSVHRNGEVDDATHGGFGDDHVVEGDILGEPLTMTPDLRRQHDALFDHETSGEKRLESREQLVHRQGGEETQSAQVHAQDGYGEIAHQTRHRQQRAVAAQDEQQVDLGGQLRLEDRRHPCL